MTLPNLHVYATGQAPSCDESLLGQINQMAPFYENNEKKINSYTLLRERADLGTSSTCLLPASALKCRFPWNSRSSVLSRHVGAVTESLLSQSITRLKTCQPSNSSNSLDECELKVKVTFVFDPLFTRFLIRSY